MSPRRTSQRRRRAGRFSLRSRLLVGVLALSAVGLLGANTASIVLLRDYLTSQMDDALASAHRQLGNLERQGFDPNIHHEEPVDEDVRSVVPKDMVIEYLAADGGVLVRLAGSLDHPPPALPALDLASARERGDRPFEVGTASGEDEATYRVQVRPLAGDKGVALVAVDATFRQATARRLVLIELVVTLVVLGVLAALGRGVARLALRPLDDVEDTAESIITGGDLSRRVPEAGARPSEIGRLVTTLNTMLAEIERAFRQRADSEARLRRFVADASHELRTPLAGIRGLAELYRQGAVRDEEETRRLVSRIETEATRMSLLVEDLLLLARMDEERRWRREPVDLVPVAVEAVESARVVDPDRPLSLVILPESGDDDAPPPTVLGDEARLHQVAANLLGNALSHTPAGTPITVRVGVDEDLRHGVLEVVDRGPGLTREQAERVFERFYRGDPARTRPHSRTGYGGTGLGLSIVDAIVTAHRGRVEYLPTPGGGATFRVTLPLADEDAPEPADRESRPALSSGSGGAPPA
ncbi:two-component system, OmpR family, sensor kinase [Streptoalloteichus tenebrarius]|uniref:histidine kinase n=1 Tax=Streptoalloteichus tenebrarius (strain ATCC 17920 / DSM 40477 / JCM 4838 / CBS 697.72 / NBRC 16177 / NCIMB 11028 / NRRL B-12390 / A12253. 1 / ISP 5477) TaxID=1933 RepID=A0ABT1HYS4_STRSD|nr:HAMP domain-containing sensor histidine kinase [Streptoalloteichus tenebrarius]MCP2260680.1 two-component system, OmpR family, sensor kinase [Streptoalloteichus tenebrarius]BFF03788.1 HAMP domain-containing sensor histidine kinase [Streptoalloteichus tenebrarius]